MKIHTTNNAQHYMESLDMCKYRNNLLWKRNEEVKIDCEKKNKELRKKMSFVNGWISQV